MFDILTYKKRFDANKVTVLEYGTNPYVVRMGSNNGQKGFIDEDIEYLNDGNTISFGQDTATMYYQEKPYFTGDKIKIFKSRYERFSNKNAHFFIAMLNRTFSKFSWGSSSFNVNVIKSQPVHLPTKNGEMDFAFMEYFISELEQKRMQNLQAYLKATGLDNYNLTSEEEKVLNEFNKIQWGTFRMGDIFDKVKTKKLPYKAEELSKEPIGAYTLPCLTSSFKNQGLNYFAPREEATVIKNVISIPSNSDVYRAYFQSTDFTVLSDAYAIKWIFNDNDLTPNQYLFAVQAINKVTDLPIYSYKNKLGGWNVVKEKYIQLPINNNAPDLIIMDNLISAIKKLAIKDVVKFVENKLKKTVHNN